MLRATGFVPEKMTFPVMVAALEPLARSKERSAPHGIEILVMVLKSSF
jgi:hypothetical protein